MFMMGHESVRIVGWALKGRQAARSAGTCRSFRVSHIEAAEASAPSIERTRQCHARWVIATSVNSAGPRWCNEKACPCPPEMAHVEICGERQMKAASKEQYRGSATPRP
jgi:hypothetical protein